MLPASQPDFSRIRIAKVKEATLLHHKHAPDPTASCGFFKNLGLIPDDGLTILLASDPCGVHAGFRHDKR
jgi:hypothetical protein